jgi:hypothetical protein
MPGPHNRDEYMDKMHALRDELNRLRRDIDTARNAAFDRRTTPDRRGTRRPAPDRRRSND